MKRIGVLRGGKGKNYETSLINGGDLIIYLHKNLADKYKPVDILIDKENVWHLGGVPISPSGLIHKVDIVWNTAHNSVANILDQFTIPHISVSAFFSMLQNDNQKLAEHIKSLNVKVPKKIIFPVYQPDFDGPLHTYVIKKAKEVHQKFGSPWVVTAYTEDKSMGIHLAQTFPELVRAIEDGVHHGKSILVEEFIKGNVISIHSVANFRGEDVYVFPPKNVFGSISANQKEKLINLTKDLHNHVGVNHYLKSIFVLNKRGEVYLLQIEAIPHLEQDTSLEQACVSVGTKMRHIVEHILENVL